jgi:hypothetical protein
VNGTLVNYLSVGRMVRWSAFLCLALMIAGCDGPGSERNAARPENAKNPPPETFFAVQDHGTELVEIETARGSVRRTLVDFPYMQPPGDARSDANT